MSLAQCWQSNRMANLAIGLAAFILCSSFSHAATLYVDSKLDRDFTKTYSVMNRNSKGTDGEAYRTIGAAAQVAKAADVVLIRGGTYNSSESADENDILWPKQSGAPGRLMRRKRSS